MKLVNCDFENQINFENEKINVLTIENKLAFFKYVNMLIRPEEVKKNSFKLFNKEDSLDIAKTTKVISDYFNFDLNSRSISKYLYDDLAKISNENYVEKIYQINSSILKLLFDLNLNYKINLNYRNEIDLKKIFKIYDLKVEISKESLLEIIIDYVGILQELKICDLIIFINLKNYLVKEEIKKFYHNIRLKDFKVLLVESMCYEKIKDERNLVIDYDLCEIVIE
jgi:CRISPR type II-A-associated protein Csn2